MIGRHTNDNLEAMAKQLYDYWFVQFDFPNEEGKPYKSSGGEMVWNETLKRNMPKGWNCAKIMDIAKTYSGGTPTSTNRKYYDGGNVPWINSGELNETIITNTTNYITEEGLNNSSAKLYPQNTILVALYGATAGKVSLLSFEACSNQAVCGVIPNNKDLVTYIRYYLSSLYEYFITLSSGSARDNISQDTIKNTVIPMPKLEVLGNFSKITDNLIEKMILNQKETTALTKQRDELLPLLMNGQATVNYHLSVRKIRKRCTTQNSSFPVVHLLLFISHRADALQAFSLALSREEITSPPRRLLPLNINELYSYGTNMDAYIDK